jgi:hypothetical protein
LCRHSSIRLCFELMAQEEGIDVRAAGLSRHVHHRFPLAVL